MTTLGTRLNPGTLPMTRARFLRLAGLSTLGLATRGFGLPSGYTGIPAGITKRTSERAP